MLSLSFFIAYRIAMDTNREVLNSLMGFNPIALSIEMGLPPVVLYLLLTALIISLA